ncbi:MAG: phosphohydrolase [Desulfobulbaceae bacterium]|jgi:hypothetical protein|nr:phosphohydrolase [Desulfobulbaceae bacterium]
MKCPGQDSQYWTENAIFETACPKCGAQVEFYKDDTSRRCAACGHRFVNPKMDFGCAAYCQFAEQCLGGLPEDFAGARQALLKDKVAVEVKRRLRGDFGRIGALTRAARHAEAIAISEKGDVAVTLCAVFLRGIGKDAAASAEIAAEILGALQAGPEISRQVLSLIRAEAADKANFNRESAIIHDALLLAELEASLKKKKAAAAEPGRIGELTTPTSRDIARRLLETTMERAQEAQP